MGGKRVDQDVKVRTFAVAFSLLESGKSSSETSDILACIPDLHPYAPGSIRGPYAKWRKGTLPEQSEVRLLSDGELQEVLSRTEEPDSEKRSEREERNETFEDTEVEERSERSEEVWRADPDRDLHSTVRDIAREVFMEMMTNERNVMNVRKGIDTEAFPPEPPAAPVREVGPNGKREGGRVKELREYRKATVTVDANLWALVEERKAAWGMSTGRTLDVLLWRALGKPRLSYEE